MLSSLVFVIVVLLNVTDSSGFAPKFTVPGVTVKTFPAAIALVVVPTQTTSATRRTTNRRIYLILPCIS